MKSARFPKNNWELSVIEEVDLRFQDIFKKGHVKEASHIHFKKRLFLQTLLLFTKCALWLNSAPDARFPRGGR